MNVYGRGGHFVAHKDTPRDVDVFGTLVACLPVAFDGGSLVLRHGSARRFAWKTASPWHGQPDETYPVHWAAFYNDVDHEIEPVLDGTRVTLTWLLRRDTAGPPIRRKPATKEADLERALAAALADRRFLPSGGLLGLPCAHLYTAGSGRAPFAGSLSERRAAALKGRDRLVARAALRAGVSLRVSPYLFETCADESWRLERPPTARERTIFQGDRLGADDLEDTLPVAHHADWNQDDDVTWILPPPWEPPERHPSGEAETPADFLGTLEYSATGYFGNEGGDAAFYVTSAPRFCSRFHQPASEPGAGAEAPAQRMRAPARRIRVAS